MILGSEEEDDIVTLDESSITSLLAGAGVTITRTSGSSSSAPRTSGPTHIKPASARVGMQSSKTRPGQVHLVPSGQQVVAPFSQQSRPAQVFLSHILNSMQGLVFSVSSRPPRGKTRRLTHWTLAMTTWILNMTRWTI